MLNCIVNSSFFSTTAPPAFATFCIKTTCAFVPMFISPFSPYNAPPLPLHVRLTKYTVAPDVILRDDLSCEFMVFRSIAVPQHDVEYS